MNCENDECGSGAEVNLIHWPNGLTAAPVDEFLCHGCLTDAVMELLTMQSQSTVTVRPADMIDISEVWEVRPCSG